MFKQLSHFRRIFAAPAITAMIVAVIARPADAAPPVNPYASAKAGDWAKFETTSNMGFGESKGDTYQVVTKREGDIVELSLRSKMDSDSEFMKCEIDVGKPLSSENKAGYFEPKPTLRFSVRATGRDTINTCKQAIKTRWTSYGIYSRGNTSTTKIWRADGIGIGGVIKKTSVHNRPSSIWTEVLVDYGNSEGSLLASKPAGPKKTTNNVPVENSLGMKLVRQKSGAFTMGVLTKFAFYAETQKLRSAEAKLDYITMSPPQTTTMIERDFFIGAHEVTIEQFRRFVEDTGYKTDAERTGEGGSGLLPNGEFANDRRFTWENYGFKVSDRHPVANVSYNDAVAFCRWLSGKENRTYRLPSESEWEVACRAGTRTIFSCGDKPTDLQGYANVSDQALKKRFPDMRWALPHNDGHVFSAPVGSFKPNAIGAADMHGNVMELTSTKFWFFEPLQTDGLEPPKELQYTVRGGNWFNQPTRAGSACRIGMTPDFRNSLTGFRIVMEVEEIDQDQSTAKLP